MRTSPLLADFTQLRDLQTNLRINLDGTRRYLTGKPTANHEAVLDDLNGEGSYAAICRKTTLKY